MTHQTCHPSAPRRSFSWRQLAWLALAAAIFTTACGGSAGGTTTTDTAAGSSDVTAAGSQSEQSNADTGGATSSSGTLAQTGPISWQELVDPSGRDAQLYAQSELDQAAANQAQAAQQLEACPMLSDATFLASVAGDRSGLPSTEATNAVCRWSYPGMSFSVFLEQAGDVDVVNHGGRAYNIDVEPVVTPQSGPGTNAVLLSDTAFVELGSDQFDYAYFFVLGDEAVTLRSTGLGMRPEAWRVMADEVAANLAAGNGGLDAAAALETASQVEAGSAAVGPVDPCGYLGTGQVAELMGIAGTPVTVSVVERGAQTQVCTWESAEGHQLLILGRTNDSQGLDYYLGIGSSDVSDRVGVPATHVENFSTTAFLPGDIEGLDTWHTIEVTGQGGFDTIRVAQMIVSRIEPP